MEPGDTISLKWKDIKLEGTLMPSQDKKYTTIKLKSGYNLSMKKSNIKNIKLLKKYKIVKSKTKQTQSNKKNKILILHTGGTIAAKVDYKTGGTISRFSPEEIIEMFPELKEIAKIDSKFIGNMWSDDLRFAHFNLMAKEVAKAKADGVIITQGTDNIHYSTAALSFILEDINIPVIFVGAQRSSDRGSSDAATNLIAASRFITETNLKGVYLCMHAGMSDDEIHLLKGTKVRKMHTSRRDAFRPINTIPSAIMKSNKIQVNEKQENKTTKLNLKLINEKIKIGIIKMHANFYAEQLEPFKKFDGLIIEGTGLGHAPIGTPDKYSKDNLKTKKQLTELAKKIPIAMTSTTIYGRINMNVYERGRELQEMGIIGNLLDMTPETAFIKLAWLLSNHKKEAKELFAKNLRGEISERIPPNAFLN